MYFHENQLVEASEYLKVCRKAIEARKEKDEDDVCCMPQYFDFPGHAQGLRGLTVRAEYKEETFHIFITPHYECFRYELLAPDYATLLGTPFLSSKIKELFQEQKYCVKVDNKHNIYSGELDENIYLCEEQNCFFVK